MAKVNFPLSTFVDLDGMALSDGYLTISLSEDAVSSVGQICGRSSATVPLDSDGIIEGSHQFWPNAELTPSNLVYILCSYDHNGQRVSGPTSVTI